VSGTVRMLRTQRSTGVFPAPRHRADIEVRTTSWGHLMSINRTRGSLYRLARILGDVQAIRKGRVGKRIGRRVVGKYAGRGMGRLFR
jgi:hypothetical protein